MKLCTLKCQFVKDRALQHWHCCAASDPNFLERDAVNIESWRIGFFECCSGLKDEYFQRRLQRLYNVYKQNTCINATYLLAATRTQHNATGLAMHEERLEASTVLSMCGLTLVWELVNINPDGHGDSLLEPAEMAHEFNTTWGDMFLSRFNLVRTNCKG